jgi:hypothetical protein
METPARLQGQLDAKPEQEMRTVGDTHGEFTQSKHVRRVGFKHTIADRGAGSVASDCLDDSGHPAAG